MNEYMTEDEYRRIMAMGTISEKSLADVRSLMATGVASWDDEPDDPDEPDPMATALADGDDPTKLRRLADWFDSRESDPEAETEVQDDLRRMARRFEEFVAPTGQLEDALRVLYTELLDHPLAPGPDTDSADVSDALEVLGAWLSER